MDRGAILSHAKSCERLCSEEKQMRKWERTTISEVADLIAGFAFKSKDFGDFQETLEKTLKDLYWFPDNYACEG